MGTHSSSTPTSSTSITWGQKQATMAAEPKFEGWLGMGPESAKGKMEWGAFPNPKKRTEDDVDIQITHCGICGSDLHTLSSGWGPTPYPCCVGHEIVGKATRVGKNVKKNIKVGDRVGVGAQNASCLRPDCEECQNGLENHCQRMVGTFASPFPDGTMSYGGYADYHRAHNHFVMKIPDQIPSDEAAPMLCGGITLYSPLKSNGCGPGKKVGIIGVGGLGHFGVLFAKALGADHVVGISRKADKKKDVLKLGADAYLASDDKDWTKDYAKSLDLIISTVSSPKMPLAEYLSLLRQDGTLVQVGAPEQPVPLMPFNLIQGRKRIGGSMIGSPSNIKEMLQLAADKNVQPWIQERPMKDANKAVVDMDEGKARFRYVL